MGTIGGPNITTNGLVLNVDAGNIKSYSGNGPTWIDRSIAGNNITLSNGPTFSNSGIFFDGVNDYGSFNFNFLNFSPFTVDFIINIPTFTQNLSRVHFLSGPGGNSMLIVNSNRISLWDETGGINNVEISYNFLINKNYHVVVTRDASNFISLYVNGSYINGISRSGQFNWVSIGRLGSVTTYCSTFTLYQFSMYNRALSASEILRNYSAKKSRHNL